MVIQNFKSSWHAASSSAPLPEGQLSKTNRSHSCMWLFIQSLRPNTAMHPCSRPKCQSAFPFRETYHINILTSGNPVQPWGPLSTMSWVEYNSFLSWVELSALKNTVTVAVFFSLNRLSLARLVTSILSPWYHGEVLSVKCFVARIKETLLTVPRSRTRTRT